MKNNSHYVVREKGSHILFRVSIIVLVLILMLVSFGSGLYFSGKSQVVKDLAREEAIYLGKLTGKYSEAKEGNIQQDIDFGLFWELWDSLKEKYVDGEGMSDKKLFYGALKGITEAVGDPYTVFMDPQKTRSFNESMSGTFEGIGAEVGMKDGILTIIAPLAGMPAEKAGLKAGDMVLAVNEESSRDMTLDEAVNKIRGEEGTDVTLTILSQNSEETKDIIITRGIIKVESIKVEILDGNIYKIEISNFNDDTEMLFNEAVEEIISKDIKGIILDLRNNPGGYLDTSVEVSSEWIESGPVVIEKFSDGSDRKYEARGSARLKDYLTVVLVNMGSASASEIVSGALQDYGRAIILGEKTFGKGSVQSLEPFSDGSSVKITVAKWLTPNGKSISEEGISPDVEVEYTLEDYKQDKTPQMDEAIKILNKMINGEDLNLGNNN
ncbi:S41 family peptidase [bacterium]|nr:S41 family peptidase [bacterium]